MGRLGEQHDNKPRHMEHVDEHGHRHVKFGDNRIDMIRTFYEDVIEGYGLAPTLKFTIEDVGEGFVRMTYDYSKVRRWKAAHRLQENLDAAITGKDQWSRTARPRRRRACWPSAPCLMAGSGSRRCVTASAADGS